MKHVLISVLGLSFAACNSVDINAQLYPVQSCGELEQSIRTSALLDMNQRLDQTLNDALLGENCMMFGDPDMAAGPTSGAVPSPPANKSEGASQASGTNNQVVGVDEADFIKNDNQYLYLVSAGFFRIIDAWPPEQAKELSKVPVDGTPHKLFVHGNRALVYSSMPLASSSKASNYGQQECTYGYNCAFTGDGHPTQLTLLDISQLSAPKVVRKINLTGSYVNSRRIGAAVHTVVTSPGVAFPKVSYYPEDLSYCANNVPPSRIREAFEKLRAANTTIINEADLTDWLPAITDTIFDGTTEHTTSNLLAQCGGFYRSGINDGSAFTTVLSLDMEQSTSTSHSTIVSQPGAVFASAEALYFAVPHQRSSDNRWGWFSSASDLDEASTVHKFQLLNDSAAARYVASGLTKGRVLNQFAMDEWGGNLRIATTTGHLPSPDVHSTLTVLKHQGGILQAAGTLDHLAPGEDIRSVRFTEQRGFIVTFKKTDPLFAFDLSNPYNPRVLGELKIPGFSTYMHLMDDQHLLTIGYDADDQGSFAWFTGVMLQIFDVSSMSNPQLIHKEVIGTRGSSSEALTNHLAFTYFPPKDLLALPMTICEGSQGGGSYGDTMTFSGLMVYDVTTQSGFQLHGKVPHPQGDDASCHNWWTDASSQVKRSIIMDDYVFSISDELIKINHLNNLATDLAALPIGS